MNRRTFTKSLAALIPFGLLLPRRQRAVSQPERMEVCGCKTCKSPYPFCESWPNVPLCERTCEPIGMLEPHPSWLVQYIREAKLKMHANIEKAVYSDQSMTAFPYYHPAQSRLTPVGRAIG